MTEPVLDPNTFSQNRQRLLDHDAVGQFFGALARQARAERLMSGENFAVDGTMIRCVGVVEELPTRG